MSDATTPYWMDSEAEIGDRIRAWYDDNRRCSITIDDIGLRAKVVLRCGRAIVTSIDLNYEDAMAQALRLWWEAEKNNDMPNATWDPDGERDRAVRERKS